MNARLPQVSSAVRQRFYTAHLSAAPHPRPILDELGNKIGFLDQIILKAGRFRVSGWIEGGAKVMLILAGARAEAIPNLFREDVAAARGCHPQVGFDLAVPASVSSLMNAEAVGLIFTRSDPTLPAARPIPIPIKRLKLKLRLLDLKLIGKAPSLIGPAIRWLRTRDQRDKLRILARLELDQVAAGVSHTLSPDVFVPSLEQRQSAVLCRVTIILPVYNAFDLLPEVIDRVLGNTDLPYHLIIIEDASPDGRVWPWLQARIDAHIQTLDQTVTLLRNDANLGFIGTVNRGLRIAQNESHACPPDSFEGPVVLLNSDAFVPQNWATRLIAPLLRDSTVATTTPMSNDAEIFSVPCICARFGLGKDSVDTLDAAAAQLNSLANDVEVPTGVGFCMAISRTWLIKVGDFDPVFGRGYGEEVDWCQRARALGGRHLAVRNLFVEHRGGSSFGSANKLAMITNNNAIISQRYPKYDEEVQTFVTTDLMITERLALGIVWADQSARAAGGALPVYLGHSLGGGAEYYLSRQIAEDVKVMGGAVVLRVGGPERWQVELYTSAGVTRGGTQDAGMVQTLLAGAKRRRLFYSCGVGDSDPLELPDLLCALTRKDDHLTVLVHDFFMLSPSYTLTNAEDLFEGTTLAADVDTTERVHTMVTPDGTRIPLGTWQARWGKMMDAADEIVVFSQNSAGYVVTVYPEVEAKITVSPHTITSKLRPVAQASRSDPAIRIGVLGGINRAKGALVLQQLGQRIAAGEVQATLTVIGEVDPSVPLPATHIHGRYDPNSITDLAEHYRLTHWLIPSVWPETFSFTTHEALATGLPVLTFDLGAQAEAAAQAPNGHILPYFDADKLGAPSVEHLVDRLINFVNSNCKS